MDSIEAFEKEFLDREHVVWSEKAGKYIHVAGSQFYRLAYITNSRFEAWQAALSHQSESHWAIGNPGRADQFKQESMAVRSALGFPSDADDVSPSDIRQEINKLTALKAESAEPKAVLCREIGETTWFEHVPVKPGTERHHYLDSSPEFDTCEVYAAPRPAAAVPEEWESGFRKKVMQVAYHERKYDASHCIQGLASVLWDWLTDHAPEATQPPEAGE